ncbi:MAG: hypothetical protein N4A49_12525 [Marinifilaceae bacterium]|jgi:hypothetical protein|nr:hypothetical protein [Marinifilaceae bacterium]
MKKRLSVILLLACFIASIYSCTKNIDGHYNKHPKEDIVVDTDEEAVKLFQECIKAINPRAYQYNNIEFIENGKKAIIRLANTPLNYKNTKLDYIALNTFNKRILVDTIDCQIKDFKIQDVQSSFFNIEWEYDEDKLKRMKLTANKESMKIIFVNYPQELSIDIKDIHPSKIRIKSQDEHEEVYFFSYKDNALDSIYKENRELYSVKFNYSKDKSKVISGTGFISEEQFAEELTYSDNDLIKFQFNLSNKLDYTVEDNDFSFQISLKPQDENQSKFNEINYKRLLTGDKSFDIVNLSSGEEFNNIKYERDEDNKISKIELKASNSMLFESKSVSRKECSLTYTFDDDEFIVENNKFEQDNQEVDDNNKGIYFGLRIFRYSNKYSKSRFYNIEYINDKVLNLVYEKSIDSYIFYALAAISEDYNYDNNYDLYNQLNFSLGNMYVYGNFMKKRNSYTLINVNGLKYYPPYYYYSYMKSCNIEFFAPESSTTKSNAVKTKYEMKFEEQEGSELYRLTEMKFTNPIEKVIFYNYPDHHIDYPYEPKSLEAKNEGKAFTYTNQINEIVEENVNNSNNSSYKYYMIRGFHWLKK